MRDGSSIEVGTVGREGVSAIPLLLGVTTSANESYCQVPGRAVVISSDHFRKWLRTEDSKFRSVLDRFLQAYVNMLGQLAACNGRHSVNQRCARWLLLTHDRVSCDEIRLSHEHLSMMLGARRSSVTNCSCGAAGSWSYPLLSRTYCDPGSTRLGSRHVRVLCCGPRGVWSASGIVAELRTEKEESPASCWGFF